MTNTLKTFLFLSTVLSQVLSNQFTENRVHFDEKVCENVTEFNDQLRQQLKSISTDAEKILDFVINGEDRGVTYRELAKFVDRFGPRLAGHPNLEHSIDYLVELLRKEQHDTVYTEEVHQIPRWSRGKEWAEMVAPRRKHLNILGLGFSVGTNGSVLTSDVVVVKSFDELKKRCEEVKGKIVVYNFDYDTYDRKTVYRKYGATFAAKYGAIAVLVRSLTSYSIDSPHTGYQTYNDSSVQQIPAVSITVEDAELFQRITSRGETVKVSLYMEAQLLENQTSRNLISEITGTQNPEEIVAVTGHIDSWDVGQGALDDANGAFISWRVLSIIKKLGLKPKRTFRSILWTAEEIGLIGVKHYAQKHKKEFSDWSVVMEADAGTFTPYGITFSGDNRLAQCIVNEVLKSLRCINASRLILSEEGSDIDVLIKEGVPGSSLDTANERYFDFHHTNGDTMSVLNTKDLDLSTAVWAVTSYAFASLDRNLPR